MVGLIQSIEDRIERWKKVELTLFELGHPAFGIPSFRPSDWTRIYTISL